MCGCPGTDAEVAAKGDFYTPLDEHFSPAKQKSFDLGIKLGILPAILEGIVPGHGHRPFSGLDDVIGLYKDTWQALKQWLLFLPGLTFAVKLKLHPPAPMVLKGELCLKGC